MKRKLTGIMGLILVMVVVLSTTAFAAAPKADFNATPKHYRSSYDLLNYVDYSIDGSTLTVSGLITMKDLDAVLVILDKDTKVDIKASSGTHFQKNFTLPKNRNPMSVEVYTHEKGLEAYVSYIYDFIYIIYDGSSWTIAESPVKEHNLSLNEVYVNPNKYKDTSNIDKLVKDTATEIVGKEKDDYEKARLLYSWVVSNIYYDTPYANDEVAETNIAAKDVLLKRYGVCDGIANLMVEFLRSQGIPAARVETLAPEYEGEGISRTYVINSSYMVGQTYPNHVYPEAFIDGRWVRMDPTWDCNNRYAYGRYTDGDLHPLRYFDITPEMMSMRQMIYNRADTNVYLDNGRIIGEDEMFTDVKQGAWYYQAVVTMGNMGIVNGVGDSRFDPNGIITFSQFCTIVARLNDLNTDEKDGYWAYGAIESCIDKGYIEARGEIDTYNYDDEMPREAAVAAMARVYAKTLSNTAKTYRSQDIPDYDMIATSYKADVLNAYNLGITNGVDSSHTFAPLNTLTRAQVCQLFYNALVPKG